jgi:hypothetical protein
MSFKFNQFHYDDLLTAWEGLNEYLANEEDKVRKSGGGTYGSEMVSYNNLVTIDNCRLDKNFNFGRTLGYTYKKWSKLVNNYCNMNYLDLIKAEVQEREGKKSTSYNYTYHFDNLHGSGKDCLISLTFMRRKGHDNPILIWNTRASEVTKRLIFDFLLIQRMAEYVYGRKQRVELICFIPFMFINLECFLMYVADRGKKVVKRNKAGYYSPYQERLLERYKHFKTVDPDKIKYKVHHRAVMQVKRDKDNNPLSGVIDCFAKDLKLETKIRTKDIDRLNKSLTII